MSWQHGQYGRKGGAHLGAMHAAVLAASQKPLVEQALGQIHDLLKAVPADINWPNFHAGVQAYLAAPHAERPDYPEVACAGRVSLRNAGGSGPVVVLIPSMVNRGYVLDLIAGHSLAGALRAAGFNVLVVDWGEPPLAPPTLTLDGVITGHLLPLLAAARDKNNGAVHVVGYCMGGLIGLAGAVLTGPNVVAKLGLIAVPWDFSVTPSSGHMTAARPVLEPWLGTQQAVIPAEVMQQYFWLLDPWSPIRRLMHYASTTPDERGYLTALEDWLNDGLALDSAIGREIILDWYADNRTLTGHWRIGEQKISPSELRVPLWVALGARDNLVPPGCAMPLVAQGNGAQVVVADAGHVGLVVGRSAPEKIYKPLASWLKASA